jgi:neurofibromin 1
MTCNILNFLDASPATLFEGPPSDRADQDRFFQENFESLVSCVIAANEVVRKLATAVAKRLLSEQMLTTLRASKCLDSLALRIKFWRLSYVPLTLNVGAQELIQ